MDNNFICKTLTEVDEALKNARSSLNVLSKVAEGSLPSGPGDPTPKRRFYDVDLIMNGAKTGIGKLELTDVDPALVKTYKLAFNELVTLRHRLYSECEQKNLLVPNYWPYFVSQFDMALHIKRGQYDSASKTWKYSPAYSSFKDKVFNMEDTIRKAKENPEHPQDVIPKMEKYLQDLLADVNLED